jgi:hypothetical protein
MRFLQPAASCASTGVAASRGGGRRDAGFDLEKVETGCGFFF